MTSWTRMTNWLEYYDDLYGDEIREGKRATKRVAKRAGLSEQHAYALVRYCRAGEMPNPPLPDPRIDVDIDEYEDIEPSKSLLLKEDYVYNEKNDTYITFLKGVADPVSLSGATHREIVRAYSNWDGQPATINEICKTVGMPRGWLVKYLRVHGITHDKEPFTTEELMNGNEDEMIDDALQMRRASLSKKFEKRKWKETEQAAEKWWNFERHTLASIKEVTAKNPLPRRRRTTLPESEEPFAVVMGLSDFHWGKYSDPRENFEAYNRKIARDRLFSASDYLKTRINAMGRPDKVYVPIGSDFLHIDNDNSSTTSGTPQDIDGTPAEILESACDMLTEYFLFLSEDWNLELVLMSGNHDRLTGQALLLYLAGRFHNYDGVSVARQIKVGRDRTPRVYRTYGSNLIGFVHGDGVKKTHELAGHMAREMAMDWGACPHRTIYTGHLHHEMTETDKATGVVRRQLISLAGTDRWHSRNGFQGAPKGLPAYIHDKNRGMVAAFHAPPED